MTPVYCDPHLLLTAARNLRGYANMLDVSMPPNANVSDRVREINEVARQLEIAAERNQGRRE